jgi:hypothetical protein
VTGVNEAVNVILGVNVKVADGVCEAVKVIEAVNVAGWNGVHVTVAVDVFVAVEVIDGVRLAVLVKVGGVGVRLGVSLTCRVAVGVTVGFKLPGAGARAMAINPMQ